MPKLTIEPEHNLVPALVVFVVVAVLVAEVEALVPLVDVTCTVFDVKISEEVEADSGKLRAMLDDARLQNDWARVSAEVSWVGQLDDRHATIAAGNAELAQ